MKPKTTKLLYRGITGVFALLLLMAGITEATQHESGREVMRHLGYPGHVLIVIGVGKILAGVALLQERFPTLREWAYAGVAFNLLGAAVARAYAGDGAGLVLSPLIFLAVMFVSYFLWKRTAGRKAEVRSGPDQPACVPSLAPGMKAA